MPAEQRTRRPRPRAKWGDRAARHEEIRQAAAAMLERDGLAGLSMRAVADEAQVGLGTVYTYFASKEVLYADLYAERLERLAAEIGPACAQADTFEQVAIAIAGCYFDVYRVFGRELNLAAILARVDQSLPAEAVNRLIAAARDVFDAALQEADRVEPAMVAAPAQRRELVVQLLWTSLNGLAEHFAGPRQILHAASRADLTQFAARVLVAGVRAELA